MGMEPDASQQRKLRRPPAALWGGLTALAAWSAWP